MKTEFEEKDFEAPLYNELRFGSRRIATPGQVFEGKYITVVFFSVLAVTYGDFSLNENQSL
ncbi:TPA: hypothetical protein ACXP05_001002 [Klebsiella variicola subsp. variicola]|uniref:hypothetical protein n=1 Tax=Klebsiella variicola TaxID=244366 RepID=UPI000E3E3AA8|nr:hypothetical protein [Klebsiella variicola]